MKTGLLRDLALRSKLRVISLAVSGAALLAAFSLFLVVQRISYWNAIAQQCELMADVLGAQSTAALEFGQKEGADAILASLRADRHIVSAAVYDGEGRLFASYARDGGQPPERPGPDGHSSQGGHLQVFRPIHSAAERIGTFHLRSDMGQMRERLLANLAIMLAMLAVAAGVIPVLTGWLGSSVAGPILDLEGVVQAVSARRDYSLRAQRQGGDEVGRLIDGFNDMLAQIQARDEALALAREELEQRVRDRTADLEREVLEHRAAKEMLQEKDARLTQAQQIAHVGSWEWDLASDRVLWSDETYRIHGLMPADFAGTYEDFLRRPHPDDRAALLRVLQEARASRSSFSLEYRVIRPDGDVRVVHTQGKVALSDEGHPMRLVGILQDVTERKTAELSIQRLNRELQLRMAELEASNKELESFSYSVSHDLRSPLRAIDGFSEALLEGYSEKLDETAKHYLGRLRAGSQRMGELIDGLLDLSRIARSEVVRREMDLGAAALEIAQDLQRRDAERQVELRIAPGLIVQADPRLLRPALGNLIENAWKYTRRRERAAIELGAEVRDGQLTYFVRDNGAGFDMRYVSKLFGVFQRLHSDKEFEGTGIGLATVRRTIERHGGRIWAEGVLDQGATFYFTLQPKAERSA